MQKTPKQNDGNKRCCAKEQRKYENIQGAQLCFSPPRGNPVGEKVIKGRCFVAQEMKWDDEYPVPFIIEAVKDESIPDAVGNSQESKQESDIGQKDPPWQFSPEEPLGNEEREQRGKNGSNKGNNDEKEGEEKHDVS